MDMGLVNFSGWLEAEPSGTALNTQIGDTSSANQATAFKQWMIVTVGPTAASPRWVYELNGHVGSGIAIPALPEGARFRNLFGAIYALANDPDVREDGEGVDHQTARDATSVLALIENYHVPAPKIFSHRSTAVVFSWDLPRVSRYLTISHGRVAVLDVDRATRERYKLPSAEIRSSQSIGNIRALSKPNAASHSV